MSDLEDVRYELDFGTGKPGAMNRKLSSDRNSPAGCAVSRIARLMALALRFEGLLREQTMQDYAELARVGGVTRAHDTDYEAAGFSSGYSGTAAFSATPQRSE